MIYYELDEEDKKILEKVQKITVTDYEEKGEYIPVENFICIIEDLLMEIDSLQEKYDDLVEDMEQNYRPISLREQVGISDIDFL